MSKSKFLKKENPSKLSGEHAIQVLEKANQMALNNEIDFLITGPVSKESFHSWR